MKDPKSKTNRKEPSLRARKTALIMLGNGGNASAAMREAGYSPGMVNNPHKLTKSKAFRELIEEYLPDDLLLRTHLEGLSAITNKSTIVGYEKIKKGRPIPIIEVLAEPDFNVRHKYLETAYKITGRLKEQNTTVPIQINYEAMRERYK